MRKQKLEQPWLYKAQYVVQRDKRNLELGIYF